MENKAHVLTINKRQAYVADKLTHTVHYFVLYVVLQ